MKRLFQSIENKAGVGSSAHPPANNITSVNINHERDINEASPGCDIGEVRHPQPIGCRRMELTVHMIKRANRCFVADRSAHWFAAYHPLEAHIAHQSFDGATGNVEAFALHLPPDFAHAIYPEVLGKDARNLRLQQYIALRAG